MLLINPVQWTEVPMRRIRHGFTLVELLVVIGIIALLLSILLPVLAHARRAARATVCLAHLQQLNAAYRMYLENNHNHSFPFTEDITSMQWFELLQPYNGNVKAILICPDASDPGNILGSAFMAWGPRYTYNSHPPKDWIARAVFTGSYGINGWITEPPAEQRPKIPEEYASKMIEQPVRDAAHVPVFGDCIEAWASPDSDDTPPYDLIHPLPYYSGTGPKPRGPKGQMAYFCIDRHFHAVNIAFMDGHAERIKLEELWKLHWNGTFKPSDVVLP